MSDDSTKEPRKAAPLGPIDLPVTFTVPVRIDTPTLPRRPEEVPGKHPAKSKTVWGLAAAVLGGVGTLVGLPPEVFAFLSDGIQVADITAIITLAGAAVAIYGARTADQPLKRKR